MKLLWIILGSISLGLGVLGIFLPLLPTTPFLLLTAALYFKGSPRLYQWLITHPKLGTYIRNYRENKAITLTTKIVSVSMLWATMSICIFVIVDALWIKLMLAAILIGVTIHLLRFKTLRKNMEKVEFIPVTTPAQVEKVAALADEIWREHYANLLTREQMDYMIDKMQSPEAIGNAIESGGYSYYLIGAGGREVGYTGVQPYEGRLFLSKIYILKEERGKGYAGQTFRFLENICRGNSLGAIWLTVNKHNLSSINAYLKSGFKVIGEEVTDIGGGFVMDDFIMEKSVR